MKLIDVYSTDSAVNMLFDLLKERRPEESISHRAMPTWERHRAFVMSAPYLAWYIVEVRDGPVGACYLSLQGEIGVSIFKDSRGQGYGSAAVVELMRLHPGRFLANINPANEASIALFRKLGFGGPIQITLEKP